MKADVVKDSFMWYFTFALYNTYKMKSIIDYKGFVKIYFKTLGIVTAIEFIMTKYTFNYFIELFLIVITVLIMLVKFNAKRKMADEPNLYFVDKTANKILSVIGGIVLLGLGYNLVVNYNKLLTLGNLFSFLLTPFLSLFFLPFYYIVFMYFNLEQTYINMKSWEFIDYKRKVEIMFYIFINSFCSIKKMVSSVKFVNENKYQLANNTSLFFFIRNNL